MHVISILRSLLAAPRRGVASALMIAVVIAGVVSMHSMSGSPTAHVTPAGIAAAHDVAAPAQPGVPASHAGAGVEGSDCSSGCGSHDAHDMTTAMCLMVLVVLLTLAAPPASFLNTVLLPFARRVLVAAPRSRPAAPPSLHALGILRT
ncbi:DUF6153 family protein [Promicromonospora soli]|nr:DUF6153 family protein [Promicromonospora soli]